MAVGEQDPLDVARFSAEPAERVEDEPAVVLEQRVDEDELAAAGVDEERPDVPALRMAEAMNSFRQLPHRDTRFQGTNAFETPRSAGSSCGKCRRIIVFMVVRSTQARPSGVYTSGV